MLKMSDDILSNKLSESHGQKSWHVIDKEIKVYKSDMDKCGFDQLLESCVKSYVFIVQNIMDFLRKHVYLKRESTLHGLYHNMKMSTIQHTIILVVI